MTGTAPAGAVPYANQATAARPEASVWVSASAGSGKTKVLADRVLRLLLAGTRPERILCLTFTRAAAAEMHNRIRLLLGQWAVEDDGALSENLRGLTGEAPDERMMARARGLFADVLDAPGGLGILTIHAFCQSLLGRFPLEAGIAPHFEVMDERATADALAAARDSVLSLAHGDGGDDLFAAVETVTALVGEEEFIQLLGQITAARSRIRRMIDRRGGVAATAAWLRTAMEIPDGETVAAVIAAFHGRAGERAAALGGAAEALAGGSKSDGERAARILAWLETPEPSEPAFDDYAGAFLTNAGTVRARLATKPVRDAMPEIEDILVAEAHAVLDVVERRCAIRTADATEAILVIAGAVLGHYERHKDRQALLDYDDLILKTRGLVDEAAPWVLFKLDGGIDHVLIDEAQDSNADQWEIVRALTDEFFAGAAAREARRTVFAVGDEKQSIFGFQGAAPDEFARMKGYFEARVTAARLQWEAVPLDKSFRSTPAVLRAVDTVFADDAVREGVSIGPVSHSPNRELQAGLVEVWPPVMPARREGMPPWQFAAGTDAEEAPPAERLALVIADRISSWIGDGEILSSTGRAIRAGDIMVLVRRRTVIVDYLSRALKAAGVEVAGADRMVVADQLAVQDLMALAAFALLPEDDLNLAAVLKGPLIGFGEEQLFEACHGRERMPLWRALRERAGSDATARRAVELLEDIRRRADASPPFEFFAHVLGLLEGRARIVARLGEQANDPVDEMLAMALAYERAHPQSLQGFLHWFWQGQAEIKRDMDQGIRDEVRILTVHGAKGLEAPIVFLADTMQTPQAGRGLLWGTDDDGGDMMLWPPRAADRPGLARWFADDAARRQDEEQRRLLYVAMTRAEDRLYVCGYGTRKSPPENCWHRLIFSGLEGTAAPFEFDCRGGSAGDSGWSETGLRLSNPQSGPPDRGSAEAPAVADDKALPEWAGEDAPHEPAPPRPLAPSRPDGGEPAVRSPAGGDGGAMFRRGLLIHRLLQLLPDLEAGARRGAARRFLESPAHGLDDDRIAELLEETFRVLDNPEYASVFGPGSRPEVPVVGVVGDTAISGRIDRLVVEPDRVRILDFKTNRPPPVRPGDVPRGYVRQMAAYRALISDVYPGREIECSLLWTDGPRLMTLASDALDAAAP